IVTDSSAYLPKSFVDRHNIRVVPLKIHWNEKTYRDGIDISPSVYYKLLARSSTIPTTSQPPVDEFLQIYEELAADHDGIIVPLISSGISGTVSSAKTAAAMFSDVPVEVIDTRSTAAGLALVAIAIAQEVADGKSLAAIKKTAETIVQRLDLFFVVDTLKYLHKGGRIGGASRYFGTALSIKPILYLNEEGKIDALDRVRTKRKAFARLIELAVEKAAGKPAHIGIMHANALDEAKQIQTQLSVQIECKQADIYPFSPVIGAHVGPGTVGIGIYPSE
ncbi:MAG: DegV family protein, partial [Anaerolineales bacterium]|nr:DegV family protein [Anaerolineales bacterium]